MARFQDQILDERLHPVANAEVWVFYASGPSLDQKAALTDDFGQPIVQPVISGPDGIFYYNAADGLYENQIHYRDILRYVQQVLVGVATGTRSDGAHGDITVSNAGVDWQINPDTITGVELADNAVATANLADGAVTTPKLADDAVTFAKLANVGTGTVFYRKSAGTGDPETQPLATLKTDLGISGTNTGDQLITLTGDVTGSGTGNINVQIAADAVGAAEIAAGAVGASELANGAIEAKLGFTPAANTVFTAVAAGLAPASGGGSVKYLRADGSWADPLGAGGGGFVSSFNTRTGAVTLLSADVTAALGFTPASTALVSTSAPGLAPTRPGGTTAFLRADGTWAAPPGGGSGGGGLTDGDFGDVVVSGGGTAMIVESATPAGGTFTVTGREKISAGVSVGGIAYAAGDTGPRVEIGHLPGTGGYVFSVNRDANTDAPLTIWGSTIYLGSTAATIATVGATGLAVKGSITATDGSYLVDLFGNPGDATFYVRASATAGGLATLGLSGSTVNAVCNYAVVGTFSPTGLALGGRLSFSANGAWAAGGGSFYKDATYGLIMAAVTGSASDALFVTPTGASIWQVPVGTQNVHFYGAVNVDGAITSGGSTLATVSQLANYLPLTGGTLSGSLLFGTTTSLSVSGPNLLLDSDAFAFRSRNQATSFASLGAAGLTVNGNTITQGTNPQLWVKGDANSYYSSVKISGITNEITITAYYGEVHDITAGFTYGWNVGGTNKMTLNSNGDLSITGALATGGGTSYIGGAAGSTVMDTNLIIRTTNYYPFITFQGASGTGTMATYGDIYANSSALVARFDGHIFQSKAAAQYATIDATGLTLNGGITATAPPAGGNGQITISPSGAGLYSLFDMKGAGGSTALGLQITAGQAGVWFNSDSFTFRKADGTTVLATISAAGTTLTGPVKSTTGQYIRADGNGCIASIVGGDTFLYSNSSGIFNFVKADNSSSPVIFNTAAGLYDFTGTIRQGGIPVATLTPREQAVASAATVTPTFTNDIVIITAQAVGLTLANWSGTAVPNHGMVIRIKAAGVQTIAYGTNYRAIGVSLPGATVAGKTLYLGCIWNATDSKIDVVSMAQEA